MPSTLVVPYSMPKQTTQQIAYDCQLYRPACPLLQAAFGCAPTLSSEFDPQFWIIAPTAHMAVYEVSPAQLTELVEITKRKAIFEHE